MACDECRALVKVHDECRTCPDCYSGVSCVKHDYGFWDAFDLIKLSIKDPDAAQKREMDAVGFLNMLVFAHAYGEKDEFHEMAEEIAERWEKKINMPENNCPHCGGIIKMRIEKE
jgi:ssDNA-binding Zn-finger/Zn-ribbon topoisomerase 1